MLWNECLNLQQGPQILKEVIFNVRHEKWVGISLAKDHKKKRRGRRFEQRDKEIKKIACSRPGKKNEARPECQEHTIQGKKWLRQKLKRLGAEKSGLCHLCHVNSYKD